jgi:hypothetical protein
VSGRAWNASDYFQNIIITINHPSSSFFLFEIFASSSSDVVLTWSFEKLKNRHITEMIKTS